MAWGFFLRIPCPVKKWDEKLKNEMLVMLPGIGLVVGLLWMLLGGLLSLLKLPTLIIGLALTLYIYGVTGFLHLDGLMDCSDAILSRRDLEERRRILKDPTIGAFAVISLVLVVLSMFAGLISYLSEITVSAEIVEGEVVRSSGKVLSEVLPLVSIPVLSRTVSGAGILKYKPMDTSGYSTMDRDRDSRGKGIGLMYLLALVICLLVLVIYIVAGGKDSITRALPIFLITAVACILGTWVTIGRARKNLDGMNGDIAGFGICIGEAAGVLALAICEGIL